MSSCAATIGVPLSHRERVSPKATGEGMRHPKFSRPSNLPNSPRHSTSQLATPHPAAPQPPSPYGRGFSCVGESSFPVQRRKCHASPASFRARWPLARTEDPFQADLSEIRAIAAGDSSAFQRLIDREAPRLVRFAYGMLGNLADAEDVVQDTLIRLLENATSWTPEARIGTWLHRVCYNRAIDVLRRRRANVDESALDHIADEADNADAEIVRSETILSVRDAIERLSARQRTAVLLFHFQDFSQRDAASVMGVSEDAFESMLARARRQLKRLIGDGGADV
jgi:RNA polymerase sigma-70 factor, ECF subfamily